MSIKNKQILLDMGQGVSLLLGYPTIASWTNKTRPKKARPGTFGFNNETSNFEYFDGNDWYSELMKEE